MIHWSDADGLDWFPDLIGGESVQEGRRGICVINCLNYGPWLFWNLDFLFLALCEESFDLLSSGVHPKVSYGLGREFSGHIGCKDWFGADQTWLVCVHCVGEVRLIVCRWLTSVLHLLGHSLVLNWSELYGSGQLLGTHHRVGLLLIGLQVEWPDEHLLLLLIGVVVRGLHFE